MVKGLDVRSKEFYELVMPATDTIEEDNDLVVTIDLPGFTKKDINLRIICNILHITAKREQEEPLGVVYYRHRPLKIDKGFYYQYRLRKRKKGGRQSDI